jgi:hypothetical protein
MLDPFIFDDGLPFPQSSAADGLVEMEAESSHANVSQGGQSWTIYTATPGYSGSAALQATPNTGVNNNTGYVGLSPRLDYRINFVKTGVHYVWVRGLGPSFSDDSIHVGIDGQAVDTADRIDGFGNSFGWTNNTLDGVRATINITTAGFHTLNVWQREDGTIVDKLLLTTNPSFVPTGAPPATAHMIGLSTGEVVSGTVFFGPDLDAHPDLRKVAYYLDGTQFGRVYNPPFYWGGPSGDGTTGLDTTTLANGAYTVGGYITTNAGDIEFDAIQFFIAN